MFIPKSVSVSKYPHHLIESLYVRMPKNFKKQKIVGAVLVLTGLISLILIGLYLYPGSNRVSGFSELLSANDVASYLEFPVATENPLVRKIADSLKINWGEEILPWAGENGAFVFLAQTDATKKTPQKLLPYIIIKINSAKNAYNFLANYSNPNKTVKKNTINGVDTYETPSMNFSILSDSVILSSSAAGLGALITSSSNASTSLAAEKNFVKTRQYLTNSVFLYFKPKLLPKSFLNYVAENFSSAPEMNFAIDSIGIGADMKDNAWQGKSYAIFSHELSREQLAVGQGYRALLLPYLPTNFEFLLAGQDLKSQMVKIDALIENDSLTKLSTLTKYLTNKYLPGMDFEKEISPLISGEFAFSYNSGKYLLILQPPTFAENDAIKKIRESFLKIAGEFTPVARQVKLPDGTVAEELIPDPVQIKSYSEQFMGIGIRGLLLGRNVAETPFYKTREDIYDADAQNKWFISNDLATLRKALALTKEPGENFRDSEKYARTLTPIMENPELLGVSSYQDGVFSFSKRTFTDAMETNFVYEAN